MALAQGTKVEGTIKDLFEGSFHKFIKCINVEYERRTTSDTFLDLQVPPTQIQRAHMCCSLGLSRRSSGPYFVRVRSHATLCAASDGGVPALTGLPAASLACLYGPCCAATLQMSAVQPRLIRRCCGDAAGRARMCQRAGVL